MHTISAVVADPAAVDLASDAGENLKVTGIAIVTALLPFGVGLYLARKAFGWAKSMVR
jgi:hypothetical protein